MATKTRDRPIDDDQSRSRPLVYAVVLNWNCWQDTLRCMQSIDALDYPNCRTLVLDNGSTDGSEQKIRESRPDVELIQTGSNLGYAGGNNVGIRRALERGAEYILLINPDVSLRTDTVTALVAAVVSEPGIGAISPIIRIKDRSESIWFAGSTINWTEGTALHEELIEPDSPGILESAWACGCCLMLSVEALRHVGLLDESYFLYFEEVDLCQRLQAAGYRVGVCTRCPVFHELHKTIRWRSPRQDYYMFRNYLYFFSRHARGHRVSWPRLMCKLYLRYLFRFRTLSGAIRRDPGAFARLRACRDFALGRVGASGFYG